MLGVGGGTGLVGCDACLGEVTPATIAGLGALSVVPTFLSCCKKGRGGGRGLAMSGACGSGGDTSGLASSICRGGSDDGNGGGSDGCSSDGCHGGSDGGSDGGGGGHIPSALSATERPL